MLSVNRNKFLNCRSICLRVVIACSAVSLARLACAQTNLFVGALNQGVVFEFSSTDDIIFTESTFTSIAVPETMVFDSSGNLFVSNGPAKTIKKITPSGVKTTFASGVDVVGMAFDPFGNLFVSPKSKDADASEGVILEFAPNGSSRVFASNLTKPQGLACDSLGNLYVADAVHDAILKISPDGRQTRFASKISQPHRLAFDTTNGDLLVTGLSLDVTSGLLVSTLFKVTPSGVVNTVVTAATIPALAGLNDVAFDGRKSFVTAGESVLEVDQLLATANVVASIPKGTGGIAVEPPTTSSAAESVVGVADFNRDGHPDYLLFNSSTRQTAIWYLNNNVFSSGVFGPTLPAGWSVVGVADFNGDGHPDYLLFNSSTRQTAIWYLNNTVFSSGAFGPALPAG